MAIHPLPSHDLAILEPECWEQQMRFDKGKLGLRVYETPVETIRHQGPKQRPEREPITLRVVLRGWGAGGGIKPGT